MFSVRSAYRMLVHNRDKHIAWLDNRPSSSNVEAIEKEWSAIWRVRVPSKIKVFIWRLARQSIPSRDVLHHRKMAPSNACAICGAPDSWRHSLLDCNMAKCVWALEREEITEHLCQLEGTEVRAWLAAVFSSLTHEDLTRVIVTLLGDLACAKEGDT